VWWSKQTMTKQIKQFGTWPSPISPRMMASSLRLNDVQWDSDGETLIWSEGRGGQGVLVAQRGPDAPRDLTTELSVGGRVGYGGGDFTVAFGQVYFAANGRLYKQALSGGGARPITPAFGAAASPAVSADGRWVAFVHHHEGVDGIAVVDTDGANWPVKLAYGADFVMQPAWHPDGKHLAYVAWNHPQMPWDGTELRLVTLENDGDSLRAVQDEVIAGDDTTAIFQPVFSPNGRYLSYVSDATDWGQVYIYDLESGNHTQITTVDAEHAQPGWIQGRRTLGWAADSESLYFLRNEQGFFSLWRYHVATATESRVEGLAKYTHLEQIAVSPVGEQLAFVGSASGIPTRIISVTLGEGVRVHRRSSSESIPADQAAEAQAITWPGHDGEDVHGLYYAPTHPQYEGIGAPPLIVHVHGGPTSQVQAGYNPAAQFFATRGFAYLEVNHRGSTGYGKAYMNKLRNSWGIYDVEDSATGAQYLADQGLADATRFVIGGGSAGGYTVLQSFVRKPGLYRAGICLYGVSNLFLLAMETHKFEERYTDSLVGPLPDAAAQYREFSPMLHADKIVDPLIVFQGGKDVVVPKNQSDGIVASLKARGIPHEYHVYPEEGHGFRMPENIEDYYERTLQFLKQQVLFS
jgi:dipeptidyl aminopeptidase/acylaminoacyl peptidase